jgi:hypothetical protein
MHLANGDIDVQRGRLPEGNAGVDATVQMMSKMAKGEYGSRSAKIRALAINIVNAANVANKDYYGMSKAIHEWVRDHIRYVKDPIGDADDGSTLNQETLSYPEETAFNSQAGDCDDMTILEMALLGSIGIQSYPVVIGTQPGRYSHVYLHIIMPPGNYAHAGEVVPADPIMREWPLGKEAPASKVKLKKLFTDLSGLGNMNLGAYASAPSYLDVRNLSSVVPALKSRITDTGSRGRIMNTAEVTRPSEDLDAMFDQSVNLVNPMQTAPRGSLRPYGPLTARAEQVMTSYLHTVPVKNLRVHGPTIRTVNIRKQNLAPKANAGGPTVGELGGLADYLSALEHEVNACAGFQGVAGKADPLHKAVAAHVHAENRAKHARHRADKVNRSIAIFGLGADPVANEKAGAANAVSQLATAIAAKARALVAKSSNGSYVRRRAAGRTYARLKTLDHAFATPDLVAKLPTGLDPVRHAATKVGTLVEVAHDVPAVQAAQKELFDRGARAIPRSPLKTPIKGAVVRDQMGRVLYSDDLAGDLGRFSFHSVTKAITKPLQQVTKAVSSIPAKIATAPVKLTQKIVQSHLNIARSMNNAGRSLFNTVKPSNIKSMFRKPKGQSAPSQPTAPTAGSNQPYTDPSTGYVYDPSTGKWTDPATGDVYDPATGQWTYANQNQNNLGPSSNDPSYYDPSMDPSSGGGGGMYPTPGGPNSDPSAYDPSFDPGNSSDPSGSDFDPSGGDPGASSPTPDTMYDSPSSPDETAFDPSSEDYPADESPTVAQQSYYGDPSNSTTPVDTFGPEDMGPTSDENGAPTPDAVAAAAASAAPTLAPSADSGFLSWLGSLFKSPVQAMDSVGASAPVVAVAQPAPAAAAQPRRRRHRHRRGGAPSGDATNTADAGPDDDASEASLYANQPGAAFSGMGAFPVGSSALTLGLVGLGAYLLLKRK